ncbi:MAG: hypothetical protein PCFJNLEI_00926 [Verrucomicrobiae bacterium]|nr:hypothetical protein [Verrucomicrobiae bacterium]
MKLKHIVAAGLTAIVMNSMTLSVRADEATLKDKIAAIDKELAPLKRKAAADPDVKAAQEAAKAAQAKVAQATEAAMIKADPKAKDLLEQRAKLMEEAAALRKAEMDAKKKPAEKKD